jgi:5,10-methylenetetrahydromethanopterin reductase
MPSSRTDADAEVRFPHLSCALPPSRDFPLHARYAEELGYSRVWAFDSPALYGDVWIALARAAEATSRIGLATGVAVPFTRHPMVTASAIASVSELAPGRLACAFGTGFTAAKALGKRSMKWAELANFVEQLRCLLNGDIVTIDGARCAMLHSPGFAPARAIQVPLYLAPMGPVGTAVAQERADGVILTTVGTSAPESHWDPVALLINGTILDDHESATSPRVLEALGAQYATMLHAVWEWQPDALESIPGGSAWRAAVETIAEQERHLAVHEGHLVSVNPRDKPVVDAAGDHLLLSPWTGSAENARAQARSAAEKGITELVYNPAGDDIHNELRRFASALIAGSSNLSGVHG